jgi:hypothetical protein
MPNMIEVNATSILVFFIYSVVVGSISFMIGGLLSANKEPDLVDLDATRCVHRKCQRRKTPDDYLEDRLDEIGIEAYIRKHGDDLNNIPPERFDSISTDPEQSVIDSNKEAAKSANGITGGDCAKTLADSFKIPAEKMEEKDPALKGWT